MSRDLPASAYLEVRCPVCGQHLVDLMGDPVCPACDLPADDDGAMPAELAFFETPCPTCGTLRLDVLGDPICPVCDRPPAPPGAPRPKRRRSGRKRRPV